MTDGKSQSDTPVALLVPYTLVSAQNDLLTDSYSSSGSGLLFRLYFELDESVLV